MANTEATVEAIFRSLPQRLRLPADDVFQGVFHWTIEGAATPAWTVTIAGEHCDVWVGHLGDPDCTVSMTEELFLGIETGARNPVGAYMKGRIKVSHLGKLKRYEQVFHKFHDIDGTRPARAMSEMSELER